MEWFIFIFIVAIIVVTCGILVHSKYDEYGFERPDDFDYVEYEKFMSVYLTILSKRSMRWSRLMVSNPRLKKNSRLKEYVRKGVPMALRAQVSCTIHNILVL